MAKINPVFENNAINMAYRAFAIDQTSESLGNLLALCEKRVFQRFKKTEGAEVAEEVANLTMLKLWRALPGYQGDDPLKLFDSTKGQFAAYSATVAQHCLLDHLKALGRRREVLFDDVFPEDGDGERSWEPSVSF